MPRDVTDLYVLALNEGYLYPIFFVEIYFVSGPVRVCTSYQNQILNGVVYTGVGASLLEIGTIQDGSEVDARGTSVKLSGIDPTLLPLALNEFQVGLPATIYLGLFGGLGGSLVIDTPVAWSGRTDEPTIMVDENTASIQINLESLLFDMNVALPYRWTQLDQQQFYPGDMGFSLVNAIQGVPIYWNEKNNSDGNP